MSDTQLRRTRPGQVTSHTHTHTEAHKDTRRPFSATDQVEARRDDVFRLASSCQMFTDHHLEEVEGRVQTVLVQLQLAAQMLDLTLS